MTTKREVLKAANSAYTVTQERINELTALLQEQQRVRVEVMCMQRKLMDTDLISQDELDEIKGRCEDLTEGEIER